MAQPALGKRYREGISIKGLFKMFPDSTTAEAWFAQERWNGKPICPKCGSDRVQSSCNHKPMPYR